jgi:hypothetical protein
VLSALSYDQRLNDSMLPNRTDEFVEVLVAENRPWLQWRCNDAIERDQLHPLSLIHGRRW